MGRFLGNYSVPLEMSMRETWEDYKRDMRGL
jgi:hypothetical protein